MGLDFSANLCLAEALRDSCERYRARTALIEVDRDSEKARLSYGDVLREGKRLASLMIEKGLQEGDRCILLMPNQSKWVVSAAAVIWAGGVIVPLDVKLSPSEQAGLIAYCEPKIVIADAEIWEKVVPELASGLGDVPVILINASMAMERASHVSWDARPRAETGRFPRMRARGDIATIVFTSGTGGAPKGCMLSDGAYLTQMESIDEIFPLTTRDRYLSIIPANHVIDFMCGFLLSLMSGATVVHQRTLRSQYIVGTLKKYRITCTALVPLILHSLRRGILEELERSSAAGRWLFRVLTRLNLLLTRRRPRFWLSRLLLKPIHDRFGGSFARFVVGGAFVDRELADFFYKIGIGLHIGYGLTEVCTVIALNDLRPYRSDTVGRVVRSGELEIRNADGAGVGEVWVRAPFLMSGYFRNEQLTSETIVDGWLRTGDLGRLERGNHLRLVGRCKNMIVTEGGKNIFPEDVELTFQDLSVCEEYCIFAAHYVWPDDRARGDRLIIVLRPKERAAATPEFTEEIRRANQRLDHFKRISGYLLWNDPFPRTASLKIKRDHLAREIRGGASREAHVIPL